jgi:hypothetical protein
LDAYAAELLSDPPVKSVAHDNPHREKYARLFARNDIRRAMIAILRAGLTPEQVRDIAALYERHLG